MSTNYQKAKDIFIQRKTATGTFEEYPLIVSPGGILITNNQNDLVVGALSDVLSGSISSSISASYLNPGTNIYLDNSYILANTNSAVPPHIPGQMWWDDVSHTYTIDGPDNRLQIGQEHYIRIIAGEYIPNGSAVYLNGSDVDPNSPPTPVIKIPVVYLAIADGTGTKADVVGIATQNISVSQTGFITSQGIVNDIDTSAFFDGDSLYLSPTNSGSYQNTLPPKPAEPVRIGTNLSSDRTSGRILVNIHEIPSDISSSYAITASVSTSSSYASTASISTSSSFSTITISSSLSNTSSYSITSSYAFNTPLAISSSHTILSDSSSYIIPGATLYVVSSSTNPSYIEPYNIPTVPYNPPYKEGRMFYDKDYSNWVYYTDQNFKLHIGKEIIWRTYNSTGGTLNTGTPVYLSGSTNGLDPDMWPAIADSSNLKSDVVGVVRYTTTTGNTGYVLQAGVIHGLDMTGFNIADPIFVSSTILGGLTNIDPGYPYESVRIGNCQVSGINGSLVISPVFKLPPVNSYAGITSNIVITSDNSGSIVVSTGSVNLYSHPSGLGYVYSYPLLEKTLSLTSGSTNYVVAEISQSVATYNITTDSMYANGISIVRVAQLDIYNETTSSWDVHQFQIGVVGLALSNRLNNKDIKLHGFERENGLTLYVTGSVGHFGITQGNIWYGPNSHIVEPFDTTVAENYTYIFHNSASNGTASWHQHTSSIFPNGIYDNGTDVTSCAPLSWSVNFVYRIIGTTDESAIVLSNDQYIDKNTAIINATTPPNLPSTIIDQSLLVGRFIVQSGSYATTTVESAFTTVFAAATVTNHESLLGLQGGQGGEHKHLTADEYLGTGTGVFVRTNQPSFTGATPGHVPYWNALQQLVLTSSVIHIDANEFVLINSGSSPDPLNKETLLVFQRNTESVNNIGAYSNINNYSQIWNQNISDGPIASTDIVATSNVGNQLSSFIDMGINGSGFTSSLTAWPWGRALDGYVMMDGGDLWLGIISDNKLLFAFNNTSSTSYADKTGFYLTGSLYGTSSYSTTASLAITASHALGIPAIKSGVVSSTFYGTPRSASIVFAVPFGGSYSITVTGQEPRIWTVQDITTASFTINSNSDVEPILPVYWQAIGIGEFYSTGQLPS